MSVYVGSEKPNSLVIGNVIQGSQLRYDKIPHFDLPKYNNGFVAVYELDIPTVFFKCVLDVNSDNIYLQIEIDGEEIFPSGDGFLLADLEEMDLGMNSGEGNSGKELAELFGLLQYAANKWIWIPPFPLHIGSNMKIKMKSSTSASNRDLDSGIVIRGISL